MTPSCLPDVGGLTGRSNKPTEVSFQDKYTPKSSNEIIGHKNVKVLFRDFLNDYQVKRKALQIDEKFYDRKSEKKSKGGKKIRENPRIRIRKMKSNQN